MNTYTTKITDISYLTERILELEVKLIAPEYISFQAGQFMQFSIGGQFRSYSIVSEPIQTQKLKFCIELLPNGLASEYILQLQPDMDITMRGPLGFFTVKDREHNIFFAATGVGIAPFVSMVPDLLNQGFKKQLTLLFGARQEDDMLYFETFSRLQNLHDNFAFIPMLSQPKARWLGKIGRPTVFLETALPDHKDSHFYFSGSQEFVKDAKTLLVKKGMDPRNIWAEIFV